MSDWRRCTVCGAATGEHGRHRHEDPDWKPRYPDFEGSLEGYECVTVDEGTVDLTWTEPRRDWSHGDDLDLTGIDWLIVGGESGPKHRPFDPQWARDLRDACREGGVRCTRCGGSGVEPAHATICLRCDGSEADGRLSTGHRAQGPTGGPADPRVPDGAAMTPIDADKRRRRWRHSRRCR